MPYKDVARAIDARAIQAGRSPKEISLIAVSKKQPIERIHAVLGEGHRVFGENQIQESEGKWPELMQEYAHIELHLLGPLQSNKTKRAVELFDYIHSLDRPKMAERIARDAQETGRCPKLFIQVNIGDEAQKAGVEMRGVEALLEQSHTLDLPIIGLMCIPPANEPAVLHFDKLASLAREFSLPSLSMGMSGDYLEAIDAGATHIRVGSAIFGERPKPIG